MILCGNCSYQNDDTARFCLGCGAKFTGEDATHFTVAEKETKKIEDDPFASIPYSGPANIAPTKKGDVSYGLPAETETRIAQILSSETEGLCAVAAPRNPLMVLLLCVVTCYLPYYIYWWYMVAKEVKAALGREDINPTVELILNILTISLFSIWLSYKYPKLMLEMEKRVKLPQQDISLPSTILTLFSFGPIAAFLIQKDLNRIWEAAPKE
jgi:hypothetical protein